MSISSSLVSPSKFPAIKLQTPIGENLKDFKTITSYLTHKKLFL